MKALRGKKEDKGGERPARFRFMPSETRERDGRVNESDCEVKANGEN